MIGEEGNIMDRNRRVPWHRKAKGGRHIVSDMSIYVHLEHLGLLNLLPLLFASAMHLKTQNENSVRMSKLDR